MAVVVVVLMVKLPVVDISEENSQVKPGLAATVA